MLKMISPIGQLRMEFPSFYLIFLAPILNSQYKTLWLGCTRKFVMVIRISLVARKPIEKERKRKLFSVEKEISISHLFSLLENWWFYEGKGCHYNGEELENQNKILLNENVQ